MAQLRGNIDAPPAQPPLYGLIAAAPTVDDPDLRNLAGGWAYVPEACGTSGRLAIACEGNTASMGDPDPADNAAAAEGDPVLVFAWDTCSTLGSGARDWQGRVRRALEATRSYELAEHLWTGTADVTSRTLDDATSDTVTSAAADPVDALGCLEAGMADAMKGRTGMVHLTPATLTHLVAASAVRLDGRTYRTPNGHIVVPDAGYPGTGPGGAGGTWMVGTGMVRVRMGPVDVLPTSAAEGRALAQVLDRGVNTIVAWATQLLTAEWDACGHVAAQLDLPTCAVGGAS